MLRHVDIAALRFQKAEIFTDIIPKTSHPEDVTIYITLQSGCCYAGTMEVWIEKFITNAMEQSPL